MRYHPSMRDHDKEPDPESMGKVLHLPPPSLPQSLPSMIDQEPDVADRLAEYVEVTEGPAEMLGVGLAVQLRESGSFSIDRRDLAEWAMAKVADAKIRLDEDQRLYEQFREKIIAWQDQVDAWYEQVTRPHRATIAFLGNHLEDYGRRWRTTSGKVASLPLPSGVIRTKTNRAKAVISDMDALVAWAKEHEPTLIHVKHEESVLVSEVRDYVEVMVDVEQNAEGAMVTGSVVVHRISKEPVPGLIVQAEHVDVTVVAEAP